MSEKTREQIEIMIEDALNDIEAKVGFFGWTPEIQKASEIYRDALIAELGKGV